MLNSNETQGIPPPEVSMSAPGLLPPPTSFQGTFNMGLARRYLTPLTGSEMHLAPVAEAAYEGLGIRKNICGHGLYRPGEFRGRGKENFLFKHNTYQRGDRRMRANDHTKWRLVNNTDETNFTKLTGGINLSKFVNLVKKHSGAVSGFMKDSKSVGDFVKKVIPYVYKQAKPSVEKYGRQQLDKAKDYALKRGNKELDKRFGPKYSGMIREHVVPHAQKMFEEKVLPRAEKYVKSKRKEAEDKLKDRYGIELEGRGRKRRRGGFLGISKWWKRKARPWLTRTGKNIARTVKKIAPHAKEFGQAFGTSLSRFAQVPERLLGKNIPGISQMAHLGRLGQKYLPQSREANELIDRIPGMRGHGRRRKRRGGGYGYKHGISKPLTGLGLTRSGGRKRRRRGGRVDRSMVFKRPRRIY